MRARVSGPCAALAAALLVLAASGVAAADDMPPNLVVVTPEQERIAAYSEFRRLFAAGQYADAVPYARTVLRLTLELDPQHVELPTAYNNLGAAELRAGDLEAAEKSFLSALDLLEATEGISSRRLISPLGGLGATLAAQGRHDLAAESLSHAIAISRRANGLFNLEQLDLLEALVQSYLATGNVAGIDRERRYALQVVQQKYGYQDPRTVPMQRELARWYEATDRYALARMQYLQIVEVASRESEGRNAAAIDGLLGVARTHRMQFAFDPGSLLVDPASGSSSYEQPEGFMLADEPLAATIGMNRDGEKSALRALEILEGTTDPPPMLLGRTLLELGDWYLTARDPARAMPYYARAWPLMPSTIIEGEDNPLLEPQVLLYRKPVAAMRNRYLPPEQRVVLSGEFKLTVGPAGDVSEVRYAGGELDESRAGQVIRALQRAIFRPRFDGGLPQQAVDFSFRETWFDRVQADEAPPAAPAN